MATPGTKPKPTRLKLIQGNPGKRPLNKREAKPSGKPKMPAGLDDLAKKEWQRMAPELVKLGLLTKVDHAIFEAYCKTYSQWVRFTEQAARAPIVRGKAQIDEDGNPVPGSGYPMMSPYVTLADKALKHLKSIAAELGLTPSSRSRITADHFEAMDDFDDFMQCK